MSELKYKLLEIPLFPSFKAFAVLVTNIKNQQAIKENVIKGNLKYDFAYINCHNLLSLEQLYSALYKTLLDNSQNGMKSKSLHTEFIYNLSPMKNIMDCLNKFGVSTDSRNMVVVKIVQNDKITYEYFNEILKSVQEIIDGNIMELSDVNLHQFSDLKKIENNFKIKVSGTVFEENLGKLNRLLVAMTQLKGL